MKNSKKQSNKANITNKMNNNCNKKNAKLENKKSNNVNGFANESKSFQLDDNDEHSFEIR